MSDTDTPAPTLVLINRHLSTMDHVQALLHLSRTSEASAAHDVAIALGLEARTVSRVLDDLLAAGLVTREPESGRYRAGSHADATAEAVAGLDVLYRTRPVTLVRLIYDRPPAALRSFSDAFRLRGPGTGK